MNRPNNDHDYDSPSLEVAYAGNVHKNMARTVYVAYVAYAAKSSAYLKKILRYNPASLIGDNYVTAIDGHSHICNKATYGHLTND